MDHYSVPDWSDTIPQPANERLTDQTVADSSSPARTRIGLFVGTFVLIFIAGMGILQIYESKSGMFSGRWFNSLISQTNDQSLETGRASTPQPAITGEEIPVANDTSAADASLSATTEDRLSTLPDPYPGIVWEEIEPLDEDNFSWTDANRDITFLHLSGKYWQYLSFEPLSYPEVIGHYRDFLLANGWNYTQKSGSDTYSGVDATYMYGETIGYVRIENEFIRTLYVGYDTRVCEEELDKPCVVYTLFVSDIFSLDDIKNMEPF